jgi:dienelactone hydrolase
MIPGPYFRFILYPGAMHNFANPDADQFAKKFNIPIGYNGDADKKSWQELTIFLKTIFGK